MAAEYIDVHGKTEGIFAECDGSVCTLGGLYAVKNNIANLYETLKSRSPFAFDYESPWDDAAVLAAARIIADHAIPDWRVDFDDSASAVAWGWSDENTKDTVVQTLRQIASS